MSLYIKDKKVKTRNMFLNTSDTTEMCTSTKNTVCLLYIFISYACVSLFLLIHVNYNSNSAIVLLFVPPIPLILLLLVTCNNKVDPQLELYDLNEIIIELRLPQTCPSRIQEEKECGLKKEYKLKKEWSLKSIQYFLGGPRIGKMDLDSNQNIQNAIDDENNDTRPQNLMNIPGKELYI